MRQYTPDHLIDILIYLIKFLPKKNIPHGKCNQYDFLIPIWIMELINVN